MKERLRLLFLLISVSAATLFAFCLMVYLIPKPSPWPAIVRTGEVNKADGQFCWTKPSLDSLGNNPESAMVRYGHELVASTSIYFGPRGRIAALSNGMNCQNCHLEAGTKFLGNNYSAVASAYPKYRERSGTKESICKRISDCFRRSLNGNAPDSLSKEMQAIKAYILWLGREVPKGARVKGAGLAELSYLDRAADTASGRLTYGSKCASCHGPGGTGLMNTDGLSYTYPPLWGPHSYNNGAGLFRLSRLAGYLYANMPFGATAGQPQLSPAEAWDLAAFINAQPRPAGDISRDWPRLEGKPIDHPFGPYADTFSEAQHKYGPFGPIAAYRKNHVQKKG